MYGYLSKNNKVNYKNGVLGKQLPVSWTPEELTMYGWFDASDSNTITESGGQVSQWDDKSGNNNHATQSTSSKQPTLGTNEITFNHSLFQSLTLGSITPPNSFTIFSVFSPNVDAIYLCGCYGPIGALNRRSWGIITMQTDIIYTYGDGTNTSQGRFDTNLSLPESNLIFGTTYLDGDDRQKAYQNGTEVSISDLISNNATNIENYASAPFSIGDSGNQGLFTYSGSIKEFIILFNEISESDRQKLEGYLAWKWGLVGNLPIGHPYKNLAPTI